LRKHDQPKRHLTHGRNGQVNEDNDFSTWHSDHAQKTPWGAPDPNACNRCLDKDESIRDFATYIPVGDAVRKLQAWKEQGAEIVYLSSHKLTEDIEKDEQVLRGQHFPEGQIFFRKEGEKYKDVAERVIPDVLIRMTVRVLVGKTK